MRLYLVRHGQTVANAERRFQGHKDFPLSDIGEEQARRVSERLENTPIDCFYASDLGRAVTTAEVIAKPHGKQVQQNRLFREYSWGVFDGLTLEDAEFHYPHVVKKNVEDWGMVDIPEKEVYSEFLKRADQAFQLLIKKHMGKRVLVVSHGRFLNALMTRILKVKEETIWAFTFVNTSVTIIDFTHNRKPKVRLFNDTNHLSGMKGYDDVFK
ncbi:histidine phosphatase family protein [Desulfuribacillus alkaliarsenatis]|uniref:Phosphoglycerate mutase n=1 Tax=Desulfuribacillus alkaliarsenatis TaxID=766136 RepID=A0A1E5G2M9_9FIRM|nr:histidine phosphatase family protein [Desulfuribacillus alkaliarsenatis]OEF97345.1 hypothetical protein BHF68_03805 [Desulfuribacillus alkaliarsenatis]